MTLTAGILCTVDSHLLCIYTCRVLRMLGMLPEKWSELINHHNDIKATPTNLTPDLQELMPFMF